MAVGYAASFLECEGGLWRNGQPRSNIGTMHGSMQVLTLLCFNVDSGLWCAYVVAPRCL
jgi:hypothetical protein